MKLIKCIIPVTVLLMLSLSCAEHKKQRDTRNLSWYEINMDARGKTVHIGLFEAYQALKTFIEELVEDEILSNLKVQTQITIIEQNDSIQDIDIFIGDIANMMQIKAANQLLTPVFSKINSCELAMKENPTYGEWMNVTENYFVPWLATLPDSEIRTWQNEKHIGFLYYAFQRAKNTIAINQHPDSDPDKSHEFLAQLKSDLISDTSFFISPTGETAFYLPVFLGVNKDSNAKAAALVTIDALIRLAAQHEALIGVSEKPELKPSIHPQWMIRILRLAD